MFKYRIIFFLHILYRRLFSTDLRLKIIQFIYSLGSHEIQFSKNKDVNNFQIKLNDAFKSYRVDKDKRKLWESHRLDFLNVNDISLDVKVNHLKFWLSRIAEENTIVFENMMECSLRASNVLIFLRSKKNVLSAKDKKIFLKFIKRTYLLNIACPDMYFKRRGIFFKDESNNHFIFCIFFQILFIYYYKKLTNRHIHIFYRYINNKYSNDGFLKEGSSFYSFSVSDALLKTTYLINEKSIIKEYKNIFTSFNTDSKTEIGLKNLNFGDSDGTRLLPHLNNCENINSFLRNLAPNSKPVLAKNFSFFQKGNLEIILNHRKIYNYGTLGHYHDDYGHFNVYLNNIAVLVDPGTLSYSDNKKRFDSAEYHNAPNSLTSASMIKHDNFVKSFKGSFLTQLEDDTTILTCDTSNKKWQRKISSVSLILEDRFQFNSSSTINLYFLSKIDEKTNEPTIKIFESGGVIFKLLCSEVFTYNITQEIIAAAYSIPQKAYCLRMNFRQNKQIDLKWEINAKTNI
jgi:hypothetical protein